MLVIYTKPVTIVAVATDLSCLVPLKLNHQTAALTTGQSLGS